MIIYPSVNAAEKKMWVWCYGILKGKRKSVFFFFFFFFYLLQNLKAETDFDCRKTKFGKKSDWNF